ncbi:thiamine diphosphokinase [Virgibacillus halophilus]|uniref:Thiamine diphosphokinase n=1 Tax=Tigheibacillus halophilus TaxID=361280 RepID=A0ABU5CAR3_9BACI|nr:thiamine diphosphokinase [Virgibacillus halophilus]
MKVGIVANGPATLLPDLSLYDQIDVWIGADRGAFVLLEKGLDVDYAVGDFDSMDNAEKKAVKENAGIFKIYPSEKDETDLELAILEAMELRPDTVLLFGATGGRMDHTLVNIQILARFAENGIAAKLIDRTNTIELALPGSHTLTNDPEYPYISFIPMTPTVTGLTLQHFYYPLENETISFGSTLCVSNKLIANSGTFSIDEGIVLVIKSRD